MTCINLWINVNKPNIFFRRILKTGASEQLNEKCYKKSICWHEARQHKINWTYIFSLRITHFADVRQIDAWRRNPSKCCKCDHMFPTSAKLPLLKKTIKLCEENKTMSTRDLLSEILHDEEEHIDWLWNTRNGKLPVQGAKNYLQIPNTRWRI